jgi:hypothetical protein
MRMHRGSLRRNRPVAGTRLRPSTNAQISCVIAHSAHIGIVGRAESTIACAVVRAVRSARDYCPFVPGSY